MEQPPKSPITAPSLEAIRETAARVAPYLLHTPTVPCYSPVVAERVGEDTDVVFKLELLQRTGSFKPRGALNVMMHLSDEEKARGVTAFSAGNHAIATAFAAQTLGISATVAMPKTANPFRVAQCQRYGATIKFADDIAALIQTVEGLQRDEGRTLVHPFEGVHTSEGTATVGLELLEDAGQLDAVIVPVGGGGLISGIAAAVKQLNPTIQVFGVEPEGATGMAESLKQGAPVSRVALSTIADSLGAPLHMPYSFSLVAQYVDQMVTVSDAEMAAHMRLMFEEMKLAVEPAGAAALAALTGPLRQPLSGRRVGVVVCGSNIDVATWQRFANG